MFLVVETFLDFTVVPRARSLTRLSVFNAICATGARLTKTAALSTKSWKSYTIKKVWGHFSNIYTY